MNLTDCACTSLPILVQPTFIRQALQAGKHVLSEKPIAKDVATARELIAWHRAHAQPAQVWAVAENFRYMGKFARVAEEVRRAGGRVTTFRLLVRSLVKTDSKYYSTLSPFLFLALGRCWLLQWRGRC